MLSHSHLTLVGARSGVGSEDLQKPCFEPYGSSWRNSLIAVLLEPSSQQWQHHSALVLWGPLCWDSQSTVLKHSINLPVLFTPTVWKGTALCLASVLCAHTSHRPGRGQRWLLQMGTWTSHMDTLSLCLLLPMAFIHCFAPCSTENGSMMRRTGYLEPRNNHFTREPGDRI